MYEVDYRIPEKDILEFRRKEKEVLREDIRRIGGQVAFERSAGMKLPELQEYKQILLNSEADFQTHD